MLVVRILMAGFFFASMMAYGCGSGKEETALTSEERFASVRVVKVKRGDIASYIFATGTLAPRQESRLGPKIEGRVEKIYADEGDWVEKGEPLVKLEQDTYLIAVREAEAALKTARAQLEKAEVNLKNITKDWKRLSALYQERAISEQRYDKMETDYDSAQAELKFCQAQVKEKEANLAMARQNFKDTITYAPFSGFVVEKLMEEGEVSNWVTYQWEVFHLQDISTVKIECPIAETKIPFLYPGKETEIEVDAYPEETFTGKITALNPKVDAHSRTFIIKIEIPNKNFKLKAGMFARVKIAEEERQKVLQIPNEALLVKGERHIVFKVKDGVATTQSVQLGISDGRRVEAMDGLKEDELIVVEGLYALKEGTKVKIFE